MGSDVMNLNELSLKLYHQNFAKYHLHSTGIKEYFTTTCRYKRYRLIPSFSKITTIVSAIKKYTIVELIYNGKHYHGLAARADCDYYDHITGIAIAYNRAFKAMIGVE